MFCVVKMEWVAGFLKEFMPFSGRLCATMRLPVPNDVVICMTCHRPRSGLGSTSTTLSAFMNNDSPESRTEADLDDGLDKRDLGVAPEMSESVPFSDDRTSGDSEASWEKNTVGFGPFDNEAVQQLDSAGQRPTTSVEKLTERVEHSGEFAKQDLDSKTLAAEEMTLFGFCEPPNHPKLRSSPEGQVFEQKPDAQANFRADQSSDREVGERVSQSDPLRQSLFLLATMAVLLLVARYFVPTIIEEVRYSWHRGELRAEYESGSEGLRNVSLDTLSRAYQMVTSAVGPSVVHIDVKQPSSVADIKIQGRVIPLYTPQTDQGSGVIVGDNGYLLTNRHVIANGEEIYVTLGDGRRLKAAIVGTDKQTDLAVLKVEADGLIPIVWGDSDRCRVGSPVWAVGSPFGLDQTVTFGILSGKHRLIEDSTHYQDFMQSDVAVNPGNSGGPLVDARGTLVGINTAIVGESYQGVSFAVPSNVAKQVYERLKEIGRVDRGWLGVRLSDVEDDNLIGGDLRVRGAVVSGLTNEFSPAAVAGLKLGDHILTVDNKAVRDLPHLMRLIGGSLAGSDITLEVVRDGTPLTVTVLLGARPDLLNQP